MLDNKQLDKLERFNDKVIDAEERSKDVFIQPKHVSLHKVTGNLTGINKDMDTVNNPLSDWSQQQLFSRFNMPTRYFRKLMDRGEYEMVARHVDYNISKYLEKTSKPNDLLVRMRSLQENSKHIIRAILTEKYERYDNKNLLDVLVDLLSEVEQKVTIDKMRMTDKYTTMRLYFPESEIEPAKDDKVYSGVVVMNSEVGASGVRILPQIFRQVCSNGLIVAENNLSDEHYRRHLYNKDENISEWVMEAFKKSFEVALGKMDLFDKSQRYTVQNPDTILGKVQLKKNDKEKILEEYQENWQQDESLFGLVNSITTVAKEKNQEDRLDLEAKAGQLLKTVKKAA